MDTKEFVILRLVTEGNIILSNAKNDLFIGDSALLISLWSDLRPILQDNHFMVKSTELIV